MHTVLFKTLVVQFYRRNAAFFFVLLAFGLGVLRNVEHYYLMMAALHSHFLLAGLLFLCTLYGGKVIWFTLHAFPTQENTFLYELLLFSPRERNGGLLMVFTIQFLPVVLYTAVLMSLGIIHGRFLSVGICLTYLGLMAVAATAIYGHALKTPGREAFWSRRVQRLLQNWQKPAFTWFLWHVLKNHSLTFLLTKGCTLVLLLLGERLYAVGDFDSRWVLFLLLLVATAHLVIVYQFHYFENVCCLWQRNIPESQLRRSLRNMLTLIAITCLEVIIFASNFTAYLQGMELLSAILYFWSLLFLYYCLLFTASFTQKRFVRHMFFFGIFFCMLILYGVSVFWLTAASLLGACLIYYRFYPAYEYHTEEQ